MHGSIKFSQCVMSTNHLFTRDALQGHQAGQWSIRDFTAFQARRDIDYPEPTPFATCSAKDSKHVCQNWRSIGSL